MTVDIGTNFDCSESLFKEGRDVSIDGASWVDAISEQHANAVKDQAQVIDNLLIPTQKNGNAYNVEMLSDEQTSIVYDAVDTVMKFLTNDQTTNQ